jgi:hypothetical protein
MIRNIATALSFLVTFAGGTAVSQENSAVIMKTVSFCVAEVRKLGEWALTPPRKWSRTTQFMSAIRARSTSLGNVWLPKASPYTKS